MGVKRIEVKVWEGIEIGRVEKAELGKVWSIGLWIIKLLLEGLLVVISKGEPLIGESVTECTGEGGKGLGEFEL